MDERSGLAQRYLFNEKSIYLILGLALLIRLYHINFPIGGFAAWRQADTAAIARNFYNNGFHFLSPEIDWGGGGAVESEFPVYPFIVSLLYSVFSPSDMLGRLVSVIFSMFTIFGLYLLVKKYLGRNTAIWSAFIYAITPLNVFYSRAFMPESAMLMCSVMGIYFFSEWIDKEKLKYFIYSVFFIAMAVLLKIPALYLGIPLLFLAWAKYQKRMFMQPALWLLALLVLIPVFLWYYHAHQIFLNTGLTFTIWGFGSDKWGMMQPLLTSKWYNDVFFKSISERHLTYALFIPFLMGLFIKRKSTEERLFDWWLIAILIYFAIVTLGNQIHEYYQLPFILPAVIFPAKVFNKFLSPGNYSIAKKNNRKLQATILICIVLFPVLSFLRISNYMKGERYDSYLYSLGEAVKQSTKSSEKILAVDNYDPVVLYSCGRKGWHSFPSELNPSFIQKAKNNGAKYLAGSKDVFIDSKGHNELNLLMKSLPVIKESDSYFILKL